MGKSGYTSLSLDEKRYAKLRKNWDNHVTFDGTFTVWATNVLERSIERERELNSRYRNLKFVGVTSDGGCIIEDNSKIIRITFSNGTLHCDADKGMCKHVLFAAMHPEF